MFQRNSFRSLSLLLVLSTQISAQNSGPIGQYEGTADVHGMGKLPITVEIREKGGKLTGILRSPVGDADIIEATFGSGQVSITLDAGGDEVFLKGTIATDGLISGEVSGGTTSGTFTLKRVGDVPPEMDNRPVINLSKEQWREDLRYLATELPKRHKNAFSLITRQQWDEMIAQLDRQIPSLSDGQVILGMAHIVSRIGDGHTWLGWASLFPQLPIRLFWFGNELRVTRASKSYPQLVGARVTKINGVNVEKLYDLSRQYIAGNESEQYVLNESVSLMTRPIFLKVVGAGSSDDSAMVSFVDVRGQQSTALVNAVANDAKVDWINTFKITPLYLEHPDEPFYYEYLADAKTVYVNFKWYPRRPEFRAFSDGLFKFIDAHDVDKLVFDFRLNGGGDFTRGRDFFVKPIKERKKFLEQGHLFAITGRRTFSAAMVNAADFRNDLHAILVGEPTGARPDGYQENRGFNLPNSHLPVSFSIELYHFSDKDTPGIIPDKLITPDWKSYRAGRDPVMEWILAYPRKR